MMMHKDLRHLLNLREIIIDISYLNTIELANSISS